MGPQTVVTMLCVLIFRFSNYALNVVGQISIPSASFSFPDGFGVGDASSLLTDANAYYNSSYSSVDMTSPYGNINYTCGRVVHIDKVRMVAKAAGQVASFNTSFTFSFLDTDPVSSGYGMAFTFAASPIIGPGQSRIMSDPGMCTFDVEDQSPSNRVFAVKFASSRYSSS